MYSVPYMKNMSIKKMNSSLNIQILKMIVYGREK